MLNGTSQEIPLFVVVILCLIYVEELNYHGSFLHSTPNLSKKQKKKKNVIQCITYINALLKHILCNSVYHTGLGIHFYQAKSYCHKGNHTADTVHNQQLYSFVPLFQILIKSQVKMFYGNENSHCDLLGYDTGLSGRCVSKTQRMIHLLHL